MVDGVSCILDFSKFSGGGPPHPPYKGNTSIKPSKSFFNNSSQRGGGGKELESPPPLKHSTRTLPLGYTEIEKKEEGAGARSFFVWFVIGLFETLICAIAEDKVCDSCIVSSWALLIFLLFLWWPNSNFLCCGITQNGESSRDLLLSVTNRKALSPGGHSPPPPPEPPHPPYKTFITLLPVTFSQLDPQLGVGWGKSLVLWDLLTDSLKLFNCQIFSRLALGIKGLHF